MSEDKSLYEDLQDSFKEHEEVETPEIEAKETVSDRDEHGRFKEKAPAEKEAPVLEAEVPTDKVALSEDKAPSSWTPKSREAWASLPADIRQEIIRREEASANGVRQMQERFAPAERFLQNIGPVAREAQAVGASPDQYILSLANTERLLRTAELPAKFNELLRLADQYGIPLREVVNQSVASEVLKKPQQQIDIPPELQQEIMEMRQWRENAQRNEAQSIVVGFSGGKEFFEDVRGKMADLVERGIAGNLDEAYDMACWSTPAVREVMLQRQAAEKASGTIQQRQQKAAGASVKSSGRVDVGAVFDEDDDIADTVRKAYQSASSGRV